MRKKLAIAKKMRNSRKSFNNIEHRKLCSKCYRTYIVECIINGKNEFILECYLNENGFKIVNEHLYSNSTVYDIARS